MFVSFSKSLVYNLEHLFFFFGMPLMLRFFIKFFFLGYLIYCEQFIAVFLFVLLFLYRLSLLKFFMFYLGGSFCFSVERGGSLGIFLMIVLTYIFLFI